MQPFRRVDMEGSGLHERGPRKLWLHAKITQYRSSNIAEWYEHLYDVYEAWVVNGKFHVTVERMTESFFAVCVIDERRNVLFSTLCSDVWEAKIVGDALFCLAQEAVTMHVEVILGWDVAYARQLRSLWMASIQHPTTTTPFSTMTDPSFLKAALLALGQDTGLHSIAQPVPMEFSWQDVSSDTTTY